MLKIRMVTQNIGRVLSGLKPGVTPRHCNVMVFSDFLRKSWFLTWSANLIWSQFIATGKIPMMSAKIDGSVKNPISALRFIPRHCGVPSVRLVPRDSQALISGFLRNRLESDFLRLHQDWYVITNFDRLPDAILKTAGRASQLHNLTAPFDA